MSSRKIDTPTTKITGPIAEIGFNGEIPGTSVAEAVIKKYKLLNFRNWPKSVIGKNVHHVYRRVLTELSVNAREGAPKGNSRQAVPERVLTLVINVCVLHNIKYSITSYIIIRSGVFD